MSNGDTVVLYQGCRPVGKRWEQTQVVKELQGKGFRVVVTDELWDDKCVLIRKTSPPLPRFNGWIEEDR